MNKEGLRYELFIINNTNCLKFKIPKRYLAEAYYASVKNAVYSEGALDLKTKRLMSLAIAVQAGCKDCMISQTSHALEYGATAKEIIEACSVAISMGGTLAWSKALVVADYLQERGLIKKQSLAQKNASSLDRLNPLSRDAD